ncbi:MAG: hypothetical protein AB1306_11470 [Nitrospirota bacterium]
MRSNKYVAYTVLALLILVIAYNVRFFSSKNTPEKEAAKSVSQPAAASPPAPAVTHVRTILKKDSSPWRDPFSLEKAEKVEKKDVRIKMRIIGIIKRDGKSLALINGRVYSINDAIGNTVIMDIKKDSVVISTNGITEEIYLSNKSAMKETKK